MDDASRTPTDLTLMDACALSRRDPRPQGLLRRGDDRLPRPHRARSTRRSTPSSRCRTAATLAGAGRERDDELARGEHRGWMHGFPQAIKDLAAAEGIRTTKGSPLFERFRADDGRASSSSACERAGAIVIGKTNTPEFGLGSHTYNGVRPHAQRLRPERRPRADRAAAPPSRSRCACCRSPTAATTAARCAIRPPQQRVRLPAVLRARAGEAPTRCSCRSSAVAGPDGAHRARPRPPALGAGRLRAAAAAVESTGSGGHSPSRSSATVKGHAHRLARRLRRPPADSSPASSISAGRR